MRTKSKITFNVIDESEFIFKPSKRENKTQVRKMKSYDKY